MLWFSCALVASSDPPFFPLSLTQGQPYRWKPLFLSGTCRQTKIVKKLHHSMNCRLPFQRPWWVLLPHPSSLVVAAPERPLFLLFAICDSFVSKEKGDSLVGLQQLANYIGTRYPPMGIKHNVRKDHVSWRDSWVDSCLLFLIQKRNQSLDDGNIYEMVCGIRSASAWLVLCR